MSTEHTTGAVAELLIVHGAAGQGTIPGDVFGYLINPDGFAIWSHVSSSLTWLELDLTRNFGRKDELDRMFPEGWTAARRQWTEKLGDELARRREVAEGRMREIPAVSDTSPHAGDQPTPDTLAAAYRDLLDTARAFKRERDAALGRLDRLHCAADLYLSSTEARHAERLQQLTDEIEAAQHLLVQPRHGDEIVAAS